VLGVALLSLSRRFQITPYYFSGEITLSLSMVQRQHFYAAFKLLVRVHHVRLHVLSPRH
jgi:hypothetical protein